MKKIRADTLRFRPYSDDPKAPPMRINWPRTWCGSPRICARSSKTATEARRRILDEHSFESDIDRFKELKHIQ